MGVLSDDNGYPIRLQVILNDITQSSGISSVLATVNSSQNTGLPFYVLPSNATAGSFKITFDMPAVPYPIGYASNNGVQGFQITGVTIAEAISSALATSSNNSSSPVFACYLPPTFVDGSSISSGSSLYAYGSSAWTFAYGGSTLLSSMPSSASSNLYVVVATPASGQNPVFNADNQRAIFEYTWNTGSTNFTLSVYDVTIHGNLLLGG